MLDLHVHCYILADKYDVMALVNYAATNYLTMAADVLALEWREDDPKHYDATQGIYNVLSSRGIGLTVE